MGAPRHSKTNTDLLHITTFTIRPGEAHKATLGTYYKFDNDPKFRNVYHDAKLESPTVVTHVDVPLDRPGNKYRMVRHFQSFSQVPHTITVRFASQTDKELCAD